MVLATLPPQNPSTLRDDERWHIEHPDSLANEYMIGSFSYCEELNPPRMHSLVITTDQFKHLVKDHKHLICSDCLDIIGPIDPCDCKYCKYGIATICCQCGDVMNGNEASQNISHGICDKCLPEQRSLLEGN